MVDKQETSGGFELALPTGTVEIVVNLDQRSVRSFDLDNPSNSRLLDGPVLCGVHMQPFLIDHRQPGRVLGIHFKPGGAAGLLTRGIDATKNLQIALEDLAPSFAHRLTAVIDERHGSPYQLMTAIASLLTSLLCKNRHPIVEQAIRQISDRPSIDIAGLVMQSGFSHRRFNQLFRGEVGLTAKQFARLMRFQQTLGGVPQSGSLDWAGLASDYGYYDQAHLIHDFQQFSAMTPTEFLARRTVRLNHPRFDGCG